MLHASRWPLFAALSSDPMPSGVQVVTWTTEHGWSGYGARRRWDWTYAASILQAVREAQPSWTRDREAEHIDASALIEQAETAAAQPRTGDALVAVGGSDTDAVVGSDVAEEGR